MKRRLKEIMNFNCYHPTIHEKALAAFTPVLYICAGQYC